MHSTELITSIKSDIQICFDLARSIDFHMISTSPTNEKAIDGKTNGLIEYGEFVTWKATHFGVSQKLTSKITEFDRPFHFRDEQFKGPLKFMIHDHYFEQKGDHVIMKDIFKFQSPYGFIGSLVDLIILKPYLTKFLNKRNMLIKEYAESELWKKVII